MGCDIARVSPSGYYRWKAKRAFPDKDEGGHQAIRDIFERGKGRWGVRSIEMRLDEEGIHMNHKKISRIMQKYHLVTKVRRKNPYKMAMKRTEEHRSCPNRLNRQFRQQTPFQIFCTDITYLPFNHRFGYLSVVKDISSGEAVAWNLSSHIDMELVSGTLRKLPQNTAMIHSDQGVHYTNPEYRTMLKKRGMIQSMSRKGRCTDNAPIESFFGHMKDEIDSNSCRTFEELEEMIEEYMHYYNTERKQWNRKKMTPVEYRNHLLKNP